MGNDSISNDVFYRTGTVTAGLPAVLGLMPTLYSGQQRELRRSSYVK